MPDNPKAFPNTGNSNWNMQPDPGMTLRDWFAGQFAIAAMVEGFKGYNHLCDTTIKKTAQVAYDLADAMLAEREKRNA